MYGLSESEIIFYIGILIMAFVVVMAIIFTVVFLIKGRKLKNRLEQEYGIPEEYNLQGKAR
jgi:heme/copper-type cytochrome/quinol oxidase subunit 2